MKATKFNLDSVHTRTCIYNSKEKLFAADIHSHSQCMNRYLVQYKRDIQEKTENSPDDYDENVRKEFDAFVNGLELDKKGYTVSYCRDAINDKLAVNKLNNRQVKQLLIGFYGEDICFTYPKDKSKPQMFFSSTICRADIVETLRFRVSIWMIQIVTLEMLLIVYTNTAMINPQCGKCFLTNCFLNAVGLKTLFESVTQYFRSSLIWYIMAEKMFHYI